jgi:hypothetical protein
VNPKVPVDRTARPPCQSPKAPTGSSDSARSPPRPKPRRKSGGRSPALAKPKLRSHQTSIPRFPNPKVRSARSAPPSTPWPEGRAASGVLPIPLLDDRSRLGSRRPSRLRRDPKISPVPIGLPVPLRSEDRIRSLGGPKTLRAPRMSEDLLGDGQGVRSRRDPKSSSSRDPADSPRVARRHPWLASWRSPLRGRSPVDSSTSVRSFRSDSSFGAVRSLLGPKPLPSRCDPFRSRKLLSDRTSGRDGPESFFTFRGLIPAAIRHSRAGCLGRYAARSSPGLSTLQGVPPLCGRLGSHRAFPSWVSLCRAQATGKATLQGIARSEVGWSLSRLPTLLGFVAS